VAKKSKATVQVYGCTIKQLPEFLRKDAADVAADINPANRSVLGMFSMPTLSVLDGEVDTGLSESGRLALLTAKYWGSGGVKLGVSFLDGAEAALRARIISHMNAWGQYANVEFKESNSGEVRIAREADGYWSYLGTDILSIKAGEPTMNLEGFTMKTSESEFHRVVRHETGHTLGFPHEHMRKELIALLDETKTLEYFRRFQGWSATVTRQQVLTPLDDASIMGTLVADYNSIMCYQLPGACTKNGQPIPGGLDIDPKDGEFAAKLYPKPAAPAPITETVTAKVTYNVTKQTWEIVKL
jgi:hypothetical protein